MGMNRIEELTYRSYNGESTCWAMVMEPQGEEPKAVVQLVHGMAEHMDRYMDFARYLSGNGVAVCGADHAGHGKSSNSPEDYGYFGEKDGARTMVEDAHRLSEMMHRRFHKVPYFILGHSMGSFVVRKYITEYADDLAGAMISGTGGPHPAAAAGHLYAKLRMKQKGRRYKSSTLDKLAFGAYNKRFHEENPTASDWLSRDRAVVQAFVDDPASGFIFTVSAFGDFLGLMREVNAKTWPGKVPQNLPLYLFSGEMDPVGNYGKGVTQVYTRLKEAGIQDVSLKLYPEGRHEMLNETNREEVYQDVLAWVDGHL